MKKYVLVTGATSGIGKGVAQRLSQNYNIVLHGQKKKS